MCCALGGLLHAFGPAHSAVLDRTPAAGWPNLVELPDNDAEDGFRATGLDVLLDQERLAGHALPELLLEHLGTDQIKVGSTKVDVDNVVARVVTVGHRVVAFAFGLKPTLAVVTRLACVNAPMLFVEGWGHGFKGRIDGGSKLRRKDVWQVDPGWCCGDCDWNVGWEHGFGQVLVAVDSWEATAVLVRAFKPNIK